MQYFLLATGEDEKLRPLTNTIPAPMCPVLDRPVMTYAIELMARHGAKEIFVALLHQGASIEQHFGSGRRWDLTLRYLPQRQPLGTAGAIKRVAHLIQETLLVLPADGLVDLEIEEALATHRAHGGLVTMICHEAGFTGAYLIEPAALALMPTGVPVDFVTELLPQLRAMGEPVHHYTMHRYWNPLRSFAGYQQAQQDMFASLIGTPLLCQQPALRFPFGGGCEIAPGIWSDTHTVIHPSAQLCSPLYIGADCRIGADVELGPGTVLGSHTIVDEGATVEGSTVLSHTYIGKTVNVQQRIVAHNLLIDQQSATALAVPDRFLLSKVTPRLPRLLLRTLLERLLASVLLLFSLPILLFIGLLLWGISGSAPLHYARRLGTKPMAIVRGQAEPTVLELVRLRTRLNHQQFLPLGQWLEQRNLHRLPELWSVIVGEIALVGVKPLTPAEAGKITEEWQCVRYSTAAGFTGLWYIQGQQADSFEAICMADTYQAATESGWQALRLLWQTPLVWARRLGQQPPNRQLPQSSEVRSQPVAQ